MLVEFLAGRARAEARHAHKNAVRTDDLVPALPYRGFDRHLDRGIADDLVPRVGWQGAEQLEAGHRDDAREDPALAQKLARLDSDGDLGSAREQRNLDRIFLAGHDLIGACGATVCRLVSEPKLRQVLPGERENAG